MRTDYVSSDSTRTICSHKLLENLCDSDETNFPVFVEWTLISCIWRMMPSIFIAFFIVHVRILNSVSPARRVAFVTSTARTDRTRSYAFRIADLRDPFIVDLPFEATVTFWSKSVAYKPCHLVNTCLSSSCFLLLIVQRRDWSFSFDHNNARWPCTHGEKTGYDFFRIKTGSKRRLLPGHCCIIGQEQGGTVRWLVDWRSTLCTPFPARRPKVVDNN